MADDDLSKMMSSFLEEMTTGENFKLKDEFIKFIQPIETVDKVETTEEKVDNLIKNNNVRYKKVGEYYEQGWRQLEKFQQFINFGFISNLTTDKRKIIYQKLYDVKFVYQIFYPNFFIS